MRSAAITSKSLLRNFDRESVKKSLKSIDLFLLLTVSALVIFGLLMVYSSSFIYAQERTGDGFNFIKKQVIYAIIGFSALLAASRVHYRVWKKLSYPLLLISIVLLGVSLIPGIGVKVGGAQRWINIAGMHFQPGELAKFAVIIFVAQQLDRKFDRLNHFTAGVMANLLFPLVALALLLFQPDFGSVAMISAVILTMMFLAGVPKKYLVGLLSVSVVSGAILILSSPYRFTRLMSYLNPWNDPSGAGFQVIQSMLGIYNGQFWGVGLGNGKQKLFYLPEAHNDFILAVIGEELGFLGLLAIVLAFSFFVYRGLKIARKVNEKENQRFGLFLASGMTLIVGIQAFINMAVVLGLLPTKGLTLPFISYGGSALVVNLVIVGVLLSVSRDSART